uniref:Progestin and adipoQ receptor family member 6 n=1 Tax=Varanus komodoensis TaxID=61221 RepID=A0A8D2JBK7_VARKO
MSPLARHVCYFLDYGALSLYSLGCAFTYSAYALPDRWVNGPLHRCFVPVATFNSFVCTSLSCYSRFLELECPSTSKILRTTAFLWVRHPGHDCAWNDSVAGYFYHLFFAALTGFLFASHLPERLAPGRFDFIGHSHQLFHVCAVLGTHFQLEAVLGDMRARRAWLSARAPAAAAAHTFAVLGAALLGNLALIGLFAAALVRAPSASLILQSSLPEAERPKDK